MCAALGRPILSPYSSSSGLCRRSCVGVMRVACWRRCRGGLGLVSLFFFRLFLRCLEREVEVEVVGVVVCWMAMLLFSVVCVYVLGVGGVWGFTVTVCRGSESWIGSSSLSWVDILTLANPVWGGVLGGE